MIVTGDGSRILSSTNKSKKGLLQCGQYSVAMLHLSALCGRTFPEERNVTPVTPTSIVQTFQAN